MSYPRISSVLALVGVVLPLVAERAGAQPYPIETLTYSIEWKNDVSPTNPTAIGAVWATITPDIGTLVRLSQGPNPSIPAYLMAFYLSVFDTLNLQNGETGALAWTVPEEFNIPMIPGAPDGNGGIKTTNVGQFGKPTNPNPNTDQKVKLLDLTWTTADLSPRFVEFSTKAITGKVFLEVPGYGYWSGEHTTNVNGSGGFNVVPGPGVFAVACVGTLYSMNRRRRTGGAR